MQSEQNAMSNSVEPKTILVIRDVFCDDSFHNLLAKLASSMNANMEQFPCADAWIWDPYGSLARSLLVRTHQLSGDCEIWVIGHMNSHSELDLTQAPWQVSQEKIRPSVDYTFQHHFNVDPETWFHTGNKAELRVDQTTRLLQVHPLLPVNVKVKGYVFNSVGPELKPILTPKDNPHLGEVDGTAEENVRNGLTGA